MANHPIGVHVGSVDEGPLAAAAEMDAELERGRAIAAGHPADEEPFLQLRDDRKLKKGSEKGLSTS